MTNFPYVWLSDATKHAGSAAWAEEVLTGRGFPISAPAEADVVVVVHGEPLVGEVRTAIAAGAGVVELVVNPAHPGPTAAAGVQISAASCPAGTGLSAAEPESMTAGLLPNGSAVRSVPEDLLARVDIDRLRPTAALALTGDAAAVLRLPGTRRRPGAVVAATSTTGDSRAVVLAVSMADAPADLLFNAVAYAARRPGAEGKRLPADIVSNPFWRELKKAVTALRPLQATDGSIADNQSAADLLVQQMVSSIDALAPLFPYDADYLAATVKDLTRWADSYFGVPDFLDSVQAFHPERDRTDGRRHLVLFPMYTQNGNPNRNVEALIIEVLWPEFIADLEAGDYSNKLFVPIRFLDFTEGYETNSAVLFPETVAMREVPTFSWGAIFADREAARFRSVVSAAADITRLALPPDAARLLADQDLAEQTFLMWDLIHDRTHMHGDLPFDPFMIKQRMPYFLYTLEELRCDLTAFRESVRLEREGVAHARLVQYAILFDRIFRFAITGNRVRNYDGLGGQLLFAWLHQHHVLHWTDNRLSVDWSSVTEPVLELGREIEKLYWQSIDRSKTAHWLAAYHLVSSTVAPHPLSAWAKGVDALPLDGPPKGLTDAVLPDEFPLSMFYEALNRKLSPVVASTAGITG